MTPAEQLRAAKALIDAPELYFSGTADARLKNGEVVTYRNKKAVQFSVIGAFYRAGHGSSFGGDAWSMLLRATGNPRNFMTDVAKLPHADVMKLFDDAIALAEAAQ